MRILFSGMIAGDPFHGGATWAVLQYVLGLRQLGHDVCLVEPINPQGTRLADSTSAAYFREVVATFGLERQSAMVSSDRESVGLSYAELLQKADQSDLLFNISGMLTDPDLFGRVPCRVYLDLDPGFNQLWHAVQGIDMRFAGHTHFVTIGQTIGSLHCPVPTCGLSWIPTWQPVVLAHWPVADAVSHDGLTTVANWRGYGSIEYLGVKYGQKAHSWRSFLDLPRRTTEKFMPALAIHEGEEKDLASLKDNGWHLLNPSQVAGTPRQYQQFIRGSRAEFSIAKSGYVAARCGWFSDRSICYLASGRPAIVQETGIGKLLPTGCGFFSFTTHDDVLTAIEALRSDYARHCRAARTLAEDYFDSDKVLKRLLERLGGTS